jgi:asparagine synthase (glutamine-hydrolysing)
MCGIAGFVGLEDVNLLRRMCDKIRHRGPDGEGYYIDGGVSLGVRRLSIIDLVSGDQPIFNEDKSIVIVFNGEIYNFVELRRRLENQGHTFSTNTDTEVIIHAYEEEGENCLSLLNGMFALALWDSRRKLLFLARDRLGEKPLYYAMIDGTLFFASEIKSILEFEGYERKVNHEALDDYLTLLYVPGSNTIFEGITELEPGHILLAQQGNIRVKQYWDLVFGERSESEEILSRHVRQLLEESVNLRLRSDVPLGVFLSGGVDSSAIAALASASVERPIQTFTVGFNDAKFSECWYARRVAEHLGTEHHEQIVEADSFKLLPTIQKYFDEPFANPTTVIQYLISEYARKHVKVALSGAGGDEVFAGYPKYTALKLLRYYVKVPSLIRLPIRKAIENLPEQDAWDSLGRRGKLFVRAAELDRTSRYASLVSYFTNSEKASLYRQETTRNVPNHGIPAEISRFFERGVSTDFMQNVYYVEMKTFLPYNILEYTDKASMAVSLESRTPYLDHRLVELSASIPYDVKLKGLTTKYILKKAVLDLLPREIVYRRKMPFSPPTGLWLRRDLKELVSQFLSKEVITHRGYLKYSHVENLLREHYRGARNNEMKIMGLISLELWFQLYMDNPKDSTLGHSQLALEKPA